MREVSVAQEKEIQGNILPSEAEIILGVGKIKQEIQLFRGI